MRLMKGQKYFCPVGRSDLRRPPCGELRALLFVSHAFLSGAVQSPSLLRASLLPDPAHSGPARSTTFSVLCRAHWVARLATSSPLCFPLRYLPAHSTSLPSSAIRRDDLQSTALRSACPLQSTLGCPPRDEQPAVLSSAIHYALLRCHALPYATFPCLPLQHHAVSMLC
jgi:hypothetical protein